MAISYAPIVDNEIVPAFYDKELKIRFKHNPAVDPNEITGFKAIIKDFTTGKILHITKRTSFGTTTEEIRKNIRTIVEQGEVHMGSASDDVFTGKLTIGNFYKFQLCYLYSNNTKESPFSYATIGRYLGPEDDSIKIYVTLSQLERKFTGSVLGNNGRLGERIYQYKFDLIDKSKNIVETTGWKLYDYTTGDTDYSGTGKPIYTTYYNFKTGQYTMRYSIITHNGYECSAQVVFSGTGIAGTQGLSIIPKQNTSKALENGYVDVQVSVTNGSTLKNCQIVRKEKGSNFWEKIYDFKNTSAKKRTIKDNTVEQGVSYEYALLSSGKKLIAPSSSNTAPSFSPDFEYMYLSDKKNQLCIRFDAKVSSFKTTLLEQKIDTLGSKYPMFLRNGQVGYKEIGISGLISYHMDSDGLFFKNSDWIENYSDYGTTTLTKSNFYLERQFRNKVFEWLTNGEPKLFRSPTEGNMIIRLMNVSITPNDQVGRMTYNFSATGYEVEDIKGQVDKYVIE